MRYRTTQTTKLNQKMVYEQNGNIDKEIENEKEPKRYSGAKDYNNRTERFTNFNSRLDQAEEKSTTSKTVHLKLSR